MKLINNTFDNRIKAHNLLFEITIEEYFELSKTIIDKNIFQRRRVKSSSTVYSLLKKDLLEGCIIPPIVLALSDKNFTNTIFNNEENTLNYIKNQSNKLIVLDGLQRTFTIRDLFKELHSNEDNISLKKLNAQKLRIEIYLGIDKLGILYRMLTLNTGQTPMSMRHQIEILYSDYLGKDLNGINLILESDDKSPKGIKDYKFKEIIDGFNSYLDRDYLPINRNSVLENIESLEKLSKENQQNDLFLKYLESFDKFIETMIHKSNNWSLSDDTLEDLSKELSGQPFGRDVVKLLKKSQLMTGFGSAIGKLIDFEIVKNYDDIVLEYEKIDLNDCNETFINLIVKLDKIKRVAKKIGNDQRMFFHHFFRELFDTKGDCHLNFNLAVNEAYSTYLRKTQ